MSLHPPAAPRALFAALCLPAALLLLAACGDDADTDPSGTASSSSSGEHTATSPPDSSTSGGPTDVSPTSDTAVVTPPPSTPGTPTEPSDTPVFTERSRIDRELTGRGDPEEPSESQQSAFPSDWSLFEPADCCDVTFIIANEADVVAARLVGSDAPIAAPGVPLAYDEDSDAWNLTVCMPLDYVGIYWYGLDVELQDESFPPYTLRRYNSAAPSGDDLLLGVVNTFDADDAESCADFDATPHETLPDP